MNLFLLPFAGASAYSYKGFEKLAPAELKLTTLELPGRGKKVRQSLLTDMQSLTDHLYEEIKQKTNEPYAIYGHSMGTILGYLIVQKIAAAGLPLPQHLFFTGCEGPSCLVHKVIMHDLSSKELVAELKKMGGSSDEVFEDEAMMAYFEPILRADFKAIETYVYEETTPLDVPISVFTGLEEEITYEAAASWQKETTQPVTVTQLPGDHFFIYDHEEIIMKSICQKLMGSFAS